MNNFNSSFRRCHGRCRLRCNHNRRKLGSHKVRHGQLAVLRHSPPRGKMIGPQIMPPCHFIHADTRHQRLRYNQPLIRIRPSTLARRTNHDLNPANLLHMVLYMSCHRRLHFQSTLGNVLADQPAVRKVGLKHRLQRTPFCWLAVARPEAMRGAFGVAQRIAGGRSEGFDQARFLKRQLSLPVSIMSQ